MLFILAGIAVISLSATGAFFLMFRNRFLNLGTFRIDEQWILGTLVLAAATEWLALFSPAVLNVRIALVVLFCLAGIWHLLKNGFGLSRDIKPPVIVFFAIFVAIVLSLKVFDQSFGYDTRTYHLMTVRWLHDFGTVTGLANLDGRLGFNSTFLTIAALFDIRGASPAYINPAVYTWTYISILFSAVQFSKHRFTEDLATVVTGCGLLFDQSLMFSLYQEPFVGFICMMAVRFSVRYFRTFMKEDLIALTLLCFFAFLVKRNLLFLTLFGLFFLLHGLRSGLFDTRTFLKTAAAGFILFVPNILRTFKLSGYPFFPIHYLKIKTEWTVPSDLVFNLLTAARINRRMGGVPLDEKYDLPVSVWLPHWFETFKHSLIPFSIFYVIVIAIVIACWFRLGTRKTPGLTMQLTIASVTLFFPVLALLSSIYFRYASHWIPFSAGMAAAVFFQLFQWKWFTDRTTSTVFYGFISLLLLISLKKDFPVRRPEGAAILGSRLISLPESPKKPVFSMYLNEKGDTLYVPTPREWSFYDFPVPAVSRIDTARHRFINSEPGFRGPSAGDGFITLQPEKIRRFGQ